ncbi:MAG: DEAD/DEAH box helicase [Cyanobacteria bacterium J06581_3]
MPSPAQTLASTAVDTDKQQTLYETYLSLLEEQRFLAQIFALLYEPSSQKKVQSCWVTAAAQQDNFERIIPPDQPSFKASYRQLIELGILVPQQSSCAVCCELIVDLVVRDAVRSATFEPIAIAIAERFPISDRFPGGPPFFRNEAQFLREVRIAIYREDLTTLQDLFTQVGQVYWRTKLTLADAVRDVLTTPLDINWIDSLSADFFEIGISAILNDSRRRCVPAESVFELLEEAYKVGRTGPKLKALYAEQLWLRGRLGEASGVLEQMSAPSNIQSKCDALKGAIAFLSGDTEGAIAHYKKGLKASGKSQRAQVEWFQHPATLLYFFALLQVGSTETLKEAEKNVLLIQRNTDHWLTPTAPVLFAVIQQQQSKQTAGAQRFSQYKLSSVGLVALLETYCLHWLQIDNIEAWMSLQLPWQCQQLTTSGYHWLALEMTQLLVSYQPESPFAKQTETLRRKINSISLVDIVERKEAWERSLDALTALAGPSANEPPPLSLEPTYRLIWRLRFESLDSWHLIPVEQKLSVKGGWTKGKKLPTKRLYGYGLPDYLTDQDKQICETIYTSYSDSYHHRSGPTYLFGADALVALVGHTHIFREDAPDVKIDVVEGEPELLVKRLEGERLQLSLSPPVTRRDVMVVKESPTRIKVIAVSDAHKRIGEVLGMANALVVPAKAEERVLKAIASIASLVTVQSDIGGGTEAEQVISNAIPHIHLLPAGEGLRVSFFIHPFPDGGSCYSPGEGGETVISVVDGVRLQTRRDLAAELQNTEAITSRCPVLFHYVPQDGEWWIEDPLDCLELLLQLQQLGDAVILEWPEGEKFKVSQQMSSSDFKFNIRRKKDWFAASGELKISDHQVMDLQQLITLLDQTTGQFVPLENGEFLALTEEFRQRLQTLSRLSQRKGKEIQINGLAALSINEMVGELEHLKVDSAWNNHIKSIKAAQSISPRVPKALKATLRGYQKEGFVWLARLAKWGVGACLADDMGLGKTLQGLAILLKRAKKGPALVIAPTSVGMNWQSETERFAPSLRVVSLRDESQASREKLLESLGPGDLLVCSYGLVQQEAVADAMAEIHWQTIVLDEAQAIKNHATKRSQAVMALTADFKIIMTGTPIENHLGELWNLFRFINPGLLGSLENFKLRFANPIERDAGKPASASAREALRQLIQPFILRRTKDQVLKELPSRTEITLSIALSEEETTFYEALRREAVEKLKGTKKKSGQRHLQVLAEIMKLRRACCNPALVKPELAIPSTKLERFTQLIEELLDNRHKALVFSQFVDHLKILRNHLDEQQINYQYLDGSTPAKKRKQAVDAFQNGEGDVFLISLKAGGSGLNLTAADYVLHMDPWWNPAVEDQASDRAHRIGQQRPVTIYRLVAKGTIEDKIVGLHKVKRDLADSLLAGSDMSSKVSTDELLSLIQR